MLPRHQQTTCFNTKMPVTITLTPTKCSLILLTVFGISIFIVAGFLGDIDEDTEHSHGLHPRSRQAPFPGGEIKYLHWFVQVSDLHISRFYDEARGPDLEHFCRDSLMRVIKPEVVLASGDLTDAKAMDKQGSMQYEDEWQTYHHILHSTGVLNTTVWLDVRGNHDTFDVPSLDSEANYFRSYSPHGVEHEQSYNYIHTTADGSRFSFIAVDACPDPGPRRPFNFFGMLSQPTLDRLEQYGQESHSSNMTVWFGHYPTSTISSLGPELRHVLRVGSVYMCGHLHNLLGWAPHMYSRHNTGTLELELGDWKDHRIYRIFAMDHNLFSFTDEVYGTWPVVLVTNPKHGQLIMPQNEPTGRMARSTHIRLLVFSNASIEKVLVSVDDGEPSEAHNVQGPLYVLPWQPELYATGVHHLHIYVQDSRARERSLSQPFSLDNTMIEFDLWPRFLILAYHSDLAKCIFCLALLGTVLPLVIMRTCRSRLTVVVSGRWQGCVARLLQLWLRRFYLVSCNNQIFSLLLGSTLYVAVGPWFIGELLTGHIGACFVFGLWVDGALIPASLTYIYGFFQLLTFHVPLQLYIGWCLDVALSQHKHRSPTAGHCGRRHRFLDYGIITILITWQAYLAYFGFFRAYGTMSLLICPIRTWSVFLALYLRWAALSKPSVCSLAQQQCDGVNGWKNG